jgi:protein-disulfide isomerase
MPFVKETYIDAGQAYLVYRDVVTNAPALMASTLAHCAGDRFFGFLDVLYENQRSWATAPSPASAREQLRESGLPEAFAAAGGSEEEVAFLYEIAGPINRLLAIGQLGGLGKDEIFACFTDFELQGRIVEDARPEFERYDVTGTPTIVVDGDKVGRGVPTREAMASAIEAALAGR